MMSSNYEYASRVAKAGYQAGINICFDSINTIIQQDGRYTPDQILALKNLMTKLFDEHEIHTKEIIDILFPAS
jgi:N-acetyl-anhydromuramyl-L-alanine amidase AmpD